MKSKMNTGRARWNPRGPEGCPKWCSGRKDDSDGGQREGEESENEVSAFEVSAFEVSAFEVPAFEVSAFEVF